MNMQLSARAAYVRTDAPDRSARQIEYDAFARVTQQMSRALQADQSDHSSLVRAVHENMRLWRVLSQDVAQTENRLPAELRARLSYLGAFTLQHSRKAMKREADLRVLIDINTAIMRGLRNEGATA